MSDHGKKSVARKCCSKPSFSLCCSTRCLQILSSTRWLWYGLGNGAREARRVSRDAYSTRLVITARPLDSRLYQAMRMKTIQRPIHESTPFHPVCCCRLVSNVQSPLLLNPHFVHFSFFLFSFPFFVYLFFPPHFSLSLPLLPYFLCSPFCFSFLFPFFTLFVFEQDFKLNVEHDMNIHDVKQFASEVCNLLLDANWTCDVSDKPVMNVVPISPCTVWDVWRLTSSVAE